MAMTNAEIVFWESLRLIKAGKLKGTGRILKFEDHTGNVIEYEEPEPIHTFAYWKAQGRRVKKGEKAIAKFAVWKHTSKVNAETGEESSKMFLKNSAWFSLSQTEKDDKHVLAH